MHPLLAQIEKTKKSKEEAAKEKNKFKAISEFKIKVLDFLHIYIKELKTSMDDKNSAKKPDPSTFITIIKGLLDSLAVAHEDRSYVLFDKIKSVILSLAKLNKGGLQQSSNDAQTVTILFTEIIQKMLNPKIDPKVSSVYRAAFFYVAKNLKHGK